MTAGKQLRGATESESATVLWWMPVHSPSREAKTRWFAILDKPSSRGRSVSGWLKIARSTSPPTL
jgi:hypothetical protein